jgi:hemoglobin
MLPLIEIRRGAFMTSLYKRLGGEASVNAAVDVFYGKVMADDSVNHFFDGVDMEKQIKKQKVFLTLAMGGPNIYSGVGLRNAHKKLVQQRLNDAHFDAILGHLGATLQELGVADDLISEAAAIVESTRDDVLNR